MIKYSFKYKQFYGGWLSKQFIYQLREIHGVGEITKIEWANYEKGIAAVEINFLAPGGIKRRNSDVVFIKGLVKERDETLKEKFLGKKAPPKLDFGVGDVIMFSGNEKAYDHSYAQRKGYNIHTLYGDKFVVVNHLKENNQNEAVQWVEKLIENDMFDVLHTSQMEARRNGFPAIDETITKINKLMNNQKDKPASKEMIGDEIEKDSKPKKVKTQKKDVQKENVKESEPQKAKSAKNHKKVLDDLVSGGEKESAKSTKATKPKEKSVDDDIRTIDKKIDELQRGFTEQMQNLYKQRDALQQRLGWNNKKPEKKPMQNWSERDSNYVAKQKTYERER